MSQITPPRKHEEIADALTREILSGRYRCGERLPSERDLALRFDANRGAVREAMKRLEQLGLARIRPGGARVAPLHEASLDVIGHMLAIGDVPDRDLMEQIFQVMSRLVVLAAENAVRQANEQELAEIRRRLARMKDPGSDVAAFRQARIELVGALMAASGNLVCRLIARSLLRQFAPRLAALEGLVEIDYEAHRQYAEKLDAAFAARDVAAVADAFAGLSRLDRESARRAFEALAARRSQPGADGTTP